MIFGGDSILHLPVDMLIASSSTDEHMSDLMQLFERLNDFGLIVNPEKYVLVASQVESCDTHRTLPGTGE